MRLATDGGDSVIAPSSTYLLSIIGCRDFLAVQHTVRHGKISVYFCCGDQKSMVECIDVYFLLLTSSCWNGIAMGCLDIAKRHLTTSAHADIGMRICDYPTIQVSFFLFLFNSFFNGRKVFALVKTKRKRSPLRCILRDNSISKVGNASKLP
ncbi:hypothetical protein E2C01_063120 [Portunus trituberculatus]|uniref:Uncharacterized protein n=1 Tax=Portunus trituberculatus TaxID=210409 RepID=A0A5B7HGN2_PORTR|nr:hypothetical protein [Portunus trituberculatus]